MSFFTDAGIFLTVLALAGTFGCTVRPSPTQPHALLVVLGNEPLDDQTPTVDMIARVKLAVSFQHQHPGTLMIFTGGRTAGQVTEAALMWQIARSLGVPEASVQLEDQAESTRQNAEFTAPMVGKLVPLPNPIYIVSKADHLTWALPLFRAWPILKSAEPLACTVNRQDSIAQMQEYLRNHDNPRVQSRLQKLQAEIKGVD